MYVIKVGEGFYVYFPPDRGELIGIETVSPHFQNVHIFEDRNQAKKKKESLTNSNNYQFKDKKIEVKQIILK